MVEKEMQEKVERQLVFAVKLACSTQQLLALLC